MSEVITEEMIEAAYLGFCHAMRGRDFRMIPEGEAKTAIKQALEFALNRRAPEAGQSEPEVEIRQGSVVYGPGCEGTNTKGPLEALEEALQHKPQAQAEPTAAESLNPNAKLSQEGVLAFAGISEPAEGQEPVAWMHDQDGRVDVIHDQVKQLWLKVGQPKGFYREKIPCMVEHYTIPLYAQPQRPADWPSLELTWLFTHCRAIGMQCKSDSGKWEHDIALFTDLQRAEINRLKRELDIQPQRPAVADEYAILAVFKRAGLNIELGHTFSVRGQIAQLIEGARELLTAAPAPERPEDQDK